MPKTQNLVIAIPDSLRRDFWPDLPGTTVDSIAAATESPTCIPAMLSGRPPEEHGVSWFQDDPTDVPTIFDVEQEGYDVGYWDNPEDLIRNVLPGTRPAPTRRHGTAVRMGRPIDVHAPPLRRAMDGP